MFSHGARKQRPCQSTGRCWFRPCLGLWCCSRTGGGEGGGQGVALIFIPAAGGGFPPWTPSPPPPSAQTTHCRGGGGLFSCGTAPFAHVAGDVLWLEAIFRRAQRPLMTAIALVAVSASSVPGFLNWEDSLSPNRPLGPTGPPADPSDQFLPVLRVRCDLTSAQPCFGGRKFLQDPPPPSPLATSRRRSSDVSMGHTPSLPTPKWLRTNEKRLQDVEAPQAHFRQCLQSMVDIADACFVSDFIVEPKNERKCPAMKSNAEAFV